jgi:hypothetical protein
LRVPDSGGRYYVLTMFDLWSDVFAAPASAPRDGPQRYAIVGPQWTGRLPDGVEPLRSPTSQGWVVCRIQTNAGTDLGDVHAFQAGLRAAPLSLIGASTAVFPTRVAARRDHASRRPREPARARWTARRSSAGSPKLLPTTRQHPNDYPQLQRMRRLGIVPGGR